MTNLLPYSERFDAVAWSPSGATVAGRTLTEAAGGSLHYVTPTPSDLPTLTVGETYTFSVHAEAGDRAWLALADYDGVGTRASYFDLTNGIVGTKSAAHATSTIAPVDGGGYRCSITFAAAHAAGYVYAFLAEANGDRSFAGDPTTYPAGIDVWGAQLETGATATDYTPNPTPGEEVAINAALLAAVPGGTVTLTAGTHTCGGNITVPAGVSLVGEPGAVLDFVAATPLHLTLTGGNTLADLDLRGAIGVAVLGSTVTVERVTSRMAVYGRACFDIRKPDGGLIENIAFTDCHAIDTSGWGFEIHHDPAADPLVVKDVAFSGCTAINCGASYDLYTAYREWVPGFDLAEGSTNLTTENIALVDCVASGCYESGFHTEAAPAAINCTMVRCTATGNGIAKPSPSWGAGIRVHSGWTLSDCAATGNYQGIRYYFSGLDPDPSSPCRIYRCQALDNLTNGITVYGWPVYRTNVIVDGCTIRGTVDPNNHLRLYYVDGAQITNLRVVDCDTATLYQYPVVNSNVFTYYLAPFRASIAAPVTGETVAFTETSDNDGLTARAWDFGDGSGSAAQHPTHAYAAPGRYVVSLTAGGTSVSMTVTVGCEPRTPGYYKQRAPNMHRMVNNARKLV